MSPADETPLSEQAADAVFEGGGVKAIAFAGALKAAEEAGFRTWVNVAGTSAGAIVAALLVAGYDADSLRTILEETDYRRFGDFGLGGRYVGGFVNQFRDRGYAHGQYVVAWLRERFRESALGDPDPTFGQVTRDLPSDLTAEERERARYPLRVVASDITSGRMLVLPDDIEQYEDERGRPFRKDDFPLVSAVRMSVSYPFLFPPVTLYQGSRPHYIVDGGLLSNFPVWLFDNRQPERPTWGFRLRAGVGAEQPPYHEVPRLAWQLPLLLAMFHSTMDAWDQLHRDHSSAVRTITIPTDAIGTTDFGLTRTQADELYRSGLETARTFFAQTVVANCPNSFGEVPPQPSST